MLRAECIVATKGLDMLTQTVTSDSNHPAVERCFAVNLWETASAAAVVELREGAVGGKVVRRYHLAADESLEIDYPKTVYTSFPGGCYVKVVSGAVGGVLGY